MRMSRPNMLVMGLLAVGAGHALCAGCARSDLDPATDASDLADSPPPPPATSAPCVKPAWVSSWAFQDPLDHSDCASRPDQACDPVANTNQWRADLAVFRAFIPRCGEPIESLLRIDLVDGCASAIESEDPVDDRLAACLSNALGSVRWSCARDTACVDYTAETI
jgi:hypothetical protein